MPQSIMMNIARTLTVFCIAMLATSPLHAVPFGVKGGMSISNITGDDIGGTESRSGFIGGGFVAARIFRFVAIQPEVLFVQKGWVENVEYSGVRHTTTARLNYLEFPVLLFCTFGTRVQPELYSGPSFAARLSTSATVAHGSTSMSGDIDAMINDTDIGWVFGFGVRTPRKLSVEARYTMGLRSIDAAGLGLEIQNTNLSFLIGYALR